MQPLSSARNNCVELELDKPLSDKVRWLTAGLMREILSSMICELDDRFIAELVRTLNVISELVRRHSSIAVLLLVLVSEDRRNMNGLLNFDFVKSDLSSCFFFRLFDKAA